MELTESETEYTVSCIKHVFPGHVVLQFDCTNTLADQLLELGEGWEEVAIVAAHTMPYNVSSTILSVLSVLRPRHWGA